MSDASVNGGEDGTEEAAQQQNTKKLDEIVPGFLYLGSLDQAENFELLRANGITHILTIGGGMPPLYKLDFGYQLVDAVDDRPDEFIMAHFEECFSFINLVLAQNGKLLVHCEGGVSRSATVCCAYLMMKEHIEPSEALHKVQRARPVAAPNIGFKQQLELFHKYNLNLSAETLEKIREELKKDVAELGQQTLPVSILSQEIFETPPENYTYELETSSKANNFIDTILSETRPKRKKMGAHAISADDTSLSGHTRSYSSVESSKLESPGHESMRQEGEWDKEMLERGISMRLFEITHEQLDSPTNSSLRASPLPAASPVAHRSQDDQDTSSKRLDMSGRQGSLRRFRTSSSTACSVETETMDAQEEVSTSQVKSIREEEFFSAKSQTTEQATKAVGKVLLGYAMTPTDERVVTQWLADKPEALTGGEAFKGLRQALRMMRRFNNSPDDEEKSALGFVGLRHSLKHVSSILEEFTGFPLHSPEFMRLLQSGEGLDSFLVGLEEEFKIALAAVRTPTPDKAKEKANDISSDRGTGDVEDPGDYDDDSDNNSFKEFSSDSGEFVLPVLPDELDLNESSTSQEGADFIEQDAPPTTRKRNDTLLGLPPKIPTTTKVASKFFCPDISEYKASSHNTMSTSHLLQSIRFGTMTPNRNLAKPGAGDLAEKPGSSTPNTNHGAPRVSPSHQLVHKRRRSATIDLLLLLSKLGLRREHKVSDRLYHSLAQFLEGGNKEMCALENLDEQSAIELLGYLESFPKGMKEDPRLERLALICKARLVLMVAIDSVDDICDALLEQPHVTGHVRDVATYCLNFSGALIGTQLSILKKEAHEKQSKAASRIQAWRRSMREAEEKVPDLISKPRNNFTTESLPRQATFSRRASTLRAWQSFEASESLTSGKTAIPPSSSGVESADHVVPIEILGVQSNSTLASINLMGNDSRRYGVGADQGAATLSRGVSIEDGSLYARRREARERQTLVDRPVRPLNAEIDMRTFPFGPKASGGASGKAQAQNSGASRISGVSSNPPLGFPYQGPEIGSVTSSNSITNSAFYQGSDLSPKTQVEIQPVHALHGILRHLSRVAVSEARQNLNEAYDLSQKLKTLQNHAKKLKQVHPRVCVADNEAREGLCRLPKASEELAKFIRDHKFSGNQTPYCYDYTLRILAFFPPCEFDTATQPPDDTSSHFRKILSTVFDLMPVDSEALHDLTETAVLSQHASAGYALTTTLHYVDKLCKTSYMVSHHLGDETCGVDGTVSGGYLRYDQESGRYVFTEESGHYGLRWTFPGTRQSLDTFMTESGLADGYFLKPFYRKDGKPATHINDLFAPMDAEALSTANSSDSRPTSPLNSPLILGGPIPVTPGGGEATSPSVVGAAGSDADSDWDFDD